MNEKTADKYTFSITERIARDFLVKSRGQFDLNRFGECCVLVWDVVIGPRAHPYQLNAGDTAPDGSKYRRMLIQSQPFWIESKVQHTEEKIKELRMEMQKYLEEHVDDSDPLVRAPHCHELRSTTEY